jgi:hypothetical protein
MRPNAEALALSLRPGSCWALSTQPPAPAMHPKALSLRPGWAQLERAASSSEHEICQTHVYGVANVIFSDVRHATYCWASGSSAQRFVSRQETNDF